MFACKYDNCRLPGPQGPIGPIGPPGLDASGNLDMSCNNILDVSNIYFCNTDALLGIRRDFSAPGYPGFNPLDIANHPVISVSGDLDLSCNYILDVSRIYFCGGPVTTGRNWIGHGTSFDISCNETLRMTVPAQESAVIQVGGTTELAIDASHVSISGGSVDTPALNFGLAGDYNTGMYHPASNEIEFVTGGGKRLLLWNKHVSIKGGNSTVPGINFGIESNDHNTGMYRVQSDTIGFSAGGTTEMIINDISHISIPAGTEEVPALNFGLAGGLNGDYDTGMYRKDANTIGFSVAGSELVSIHATLDDPSFIRGLNVGVPDKPTEGIRRCSQIPTNSWEDGHLGNPDFIYFHTQDFNCDNGSRFLTHLTAAGAGPSGSGRWGPFAMYTVTANLNIVAQKIIPKGFRIKQATARPLCEVYSRITPAPTPGAIVMWIGEGTITGNAGSITNLGINAPTSSVGETLVWASGIATCQTTVAGSHSDGKLVACIYLDISGTLSAGAGIVGARIPIERI